VEITTTNALTDANRVFIGFKENFPYRARPVKLNALVAQRRNKVNGIDLTSGDEGPQVVAAAMIFNTLIAFRLAKGTVSPENTAKDLDTAAQLASGLAGRIHNLNSQAAAPPADPDDVLDQLGAAS